jgi:membrane fusion protein, multidrug efflux system
MRTAIMRRSRRFYNPAASLLAATLALTALSCSSGGAGQQAEIPAITVRVVPAIAADVPLEIAAIGNVEAISTVDVKARITAPVLKVLFNEGEDVRQGQPLFELDPEPFNRQIAEIEANIAKDVANETQAEANITRDQATLKNLESMAHRGTQLLNEGILSREQSEQSDSNASAAQASVGADRAALESAKAAATADRARLQQTRLQVDYTKIYAPIAGRAGAIAIKQGGLAKENDTTLVTIMQTAPIYVSFSVPENLLPEIRRYNGSKPLEITATGSDGKAGEGRLQFIDNAVDTTSGTIKLKASFSNAARTLWPGQFVNVRATLSVERGRVLVSSEALQTGPQGKYVWVFNPSDSTVSMRSVTILRIYSPAGSAEKAVVGAGLQPGDKVISEGQMKLAPGAHVRLLQPSAAPAG